MPNVPRHCHQVNCFQKGILEFEGPMRQCFCRFPTVSSRRRGEKRKKDTGLTGKVNESNSHIPYLQEQLVFAWHNRLMLDRRLGAVSWYSRCSQPTLQRRYEGVQRSIAKRTDITFYVLVALNDTKRMYGIQSPDPVALTSFSSIIRPLRIMGYEAKGDMAIKVMVL